METKAWLRRGENSDGDGKEEEDAGRSTCAMTSSSGVFMTSPSDISSSSSYSKTRKVRIEEVRMKDEAEASTLIVNPQSNLVTTL